MTCLLLLLLSTARRPIRAQVNVGFPLPGPALRLLLLSSGSLAAGAVLDPGVAAIVVLHSATLLRLPVVLGMVPGRRARVSETLSGRIAVRRPVPADRVAVPAPVPVIAAIVAILPALPLGMTVRAVSAGICSILWATLSVIRALTRILPAPGA
jgi:hypothetical protein